jgi:predicted RNase H-like HicB family nuclease
MARYAALVDGSDGAYGAVFPDAPGCTAMGGTLDETLRNAAAALAEWVGDEIADGRLPPIARPMDELSKEPDAIAALKRGAVFAYVPLILNSGKPAKANVSLDAGLLRAIDEAAKRAGLTRSAFLATAAREKIEADA